MGSERAEIWWWRLFGAPWTWLVHFFGEVLIGGDEPHCYWCYRRRRV